MARLMVEYDAKHSRWNLVASDGRIVGCVWEYDAEDAPDFEAQARQWAASGEMTALLQEIRSWMFAQGEPAFPDRDRSRRIYWAIGELLYPTT